MYILFLVLSIISSIYSYDYHLLASDWMGTSCLFYPCENEDILRADQNSWNIHGLWPQNYEGYPSFCQQEMPFSLEYFDEEIRSLLNMHWVSYRKNSTSFHGHEWRKHGTCWNYEHQHITPHLKIREYFITTTRVFQQFNPYILLSQAGILPNEDSYSLKEIRNAFDRAWGANNYALECKLDSTRKQFLKSVYLCLDHYYQITSCSNLTFTACRDIKTFYPFFPTTIINSKLQDTKKRIDNSL